MRELARLCDPILILATSILRFLAAKCELGTCVHQAIEDDINGGFPSPGKKGLGYFQSYVKWRDKIEPKIIQTEQRYFDDTHLITGKIDALMLIPGEILPILVDFKTSSIVSYMGNASESLYAPYFLAKVALSGRALF